MTIKIQFESMAQYNALMNQKIINAISSESVNGLSKEQLWEDKGAFFGSILGSLNHILVCDLIWLRRFNAHPNYPQGFKSLDALDSFAIPISLDQIICDTLTDYQSNRVILDSIVLDFVNEITPVDFEVGLAYINTQGERFTKPFGLLLQHFFNHQTHHRGQVTTLLNQTKIDIGSTDLLMLI